MYEQIASNKRKTYFLIASFTVIFVILGWLLGYRFATPSIGIFFATIVAVITTLIGYFGGDKVALATAHAKQIQKSDNPVLFSMVENLAITVGLQTPKIYVIDDPAPNAFAAGRDPEHASIAVSTGLLRILEKTELEGVIAHEMAHIKNYDVRVMTLVVVLVGGIMLLSDILMRSFFFGNKRETPGGQYVLLLFGVGVVLAMVSPLLAELIKLAVSRSREYLADASGALMTRYPEGLAGALEKIAKHDKRMKHANHATAHLYFANPFDPHVTKKFELMFSTHPPIMERIKKLRTM